VPGPGPTGNRRALDAPQSSPQGKATTVRLTGVDTPETVHPSKPVERFGREAARFLKDLIGGKSVRLVHDPGSAHRDRYGRTLGYLYLEPGGLFVNREIVARGYEHAYTKYPFRFMDEFRAAERSARERRLGLWAPGAGTEPDSPAPPETTVYVTRTGTKYHRSGCRALARGSTPMPLRRAVERYLSCALCKPPSLAGSGSR
jgi:micrococcal nuclease